ncbi:MAG: ATP-binding cassette domain-containing protein [Methanobacteriota archaeon]
MIRVGGVSKRFGPTGTMALDNVTFRVARGETFGVLGADGSGKTTLFRILTGLLAPTRGRAFVRDLDVREDRGMLGAVMGYAPQVASLPLNRTVAQTLELWARADGMSAGARRGRVRELLASFELDARADERVVDCTAYEQRRLSLAVALLTDPPLLLLDEPMAGLSPADHLAVRKHFVAFKEAGKTILLSAPKLGSLQPVCDRILTLAEGRATRPYETAELLRVLGQARHARVFVQVDGTVTGATGLLRSVPGVLDAQDTGAAILLFVSPGQFAEDTARATLEGAGVRVQSLKAAEIVLNDIVRTLVRREPT